jgi:hypothetical protein
LSLSFIPPRTIFSRSSVLPRYVGKLLIKCQ